MVCFLLYTNINSKITKGNGYKPRRDALWPASSFPLPVLKDKAFSLSSYKKKSVINKLDILDILVYLIIR